MKDKITIHIPEEPVKNYTKGPNVTVSLRLNKSLLAAIDRIAKKKNRDRTSVISLVLDQAISNMEGK